MEFLLDYLPLLIWWGTYFFTGDIITATKVLIPTTIIVMGVSFWFTRKIKKMTVFLCLAVVVFGGATVFLEDALFIIWKTTVINWLLAGTFFASHFFGEKTIVKYMLGKTIELDEVDWTRLSFSWILFFIISGSANLFVGFTFEESVWVNFKMFGLLGLTFIFIIGQTIWLNKRAVFVQSEDKST